MPFVDCQAPFGINLLYTLGWLVEVLVRLYSWTVVQVWAHAPKAGLWLGAVLDYASRHLGRLSPPQLVGVVS
jgi:hypothetical protein